MSGGDWEGRFEELSGEYFPGSSEKIPKQRSELSAPVAVAAQEWAGSPSYYTLNGVKYEVFFIGHLAKALSRKPVTIRLWEDQGFIPPTRKADTVRPNMGRRLYSRAQIEGLIRIAKEEGVYGSAHARLNRTRFEEKALDLFLDLAQKPLNGAKAVEGEQ